MEEKVLPRVRRGETFREGLVMVEKGSILTGEGRNPERY